ncbi:DNA methyltransferase [Patescibacteria group bacterium]
MHKYGFILGRKWRLSVAELQSVFGCEGKTAEGQVWINEFEEELSADVLARLGGTIKIVKFFDECSDFGEVEKKFIDHLLKLENQKIKFALSLFNFNKQFLTKHKKILNNLKRGLKEEKRGARFLNKPNQNIKSVVIFEEKLDIKKSDLNLVKFDGKFLLGYCIAVQNFKKYSYRDYERPARDSKSGMLPPKLAQIMINLACSGEGECVLYDPFCGSGTVLMEGLLMGKKVIGSDISEKAIKDSEQNLQWLGKHFEVERSYDLFLKDATELSGGDFSILPGCVVSEVYLGPPQSKLPAEKEMKANFKEIESIIIGALESLKGILKEGSNVVLAVPFYRGRSGNYFLPMFNKNLANLGYNIEKWPRLSTDRGALLYFRSDQIVGREIFKLKMVEK